MKRHPVLRPLSREHHQFLTWCRNARWFAEGSPRAPDLETLLAELRRLLPAIEAHFRTEEEILFPLVEAALGKPGKWVGIYFRSLRGGHDLWRRHIPRVIELAEEQPDLLVKMARLLHDHIRFEERNVFPILQEELSEAQWQAIANQLDSNPAH